MLLTICHEDTLRQDRFPYRPALHRRRRLPAAPPLEIGNEFLFHCYLFPVPPAGLSFCAGAGFRRGAAPLETGNEFLFHCYLFPVPLAGLSFCAGAGFGRGAAPLEIGNEFLFH